MSAVRIACPPKERMQKMMNTKAGEFTITVPTINPVKQGADLPVNISLQRGSEFKQDVKLDFRSEDIQVTPNVITIKSTDKPNANLKIVIPKDAKVGDHKISVKGTPNTGTPTSSEFIVKVVAQ